MHFTKEKWAHPSLFYLRFAEGRELNYEMEKSVNSNINLYINLKIQSNQSTMKKTPVNTLNIKNIQKNTGN